MLYLIYLFTSLILLSCDLVNSTENSLKVSWSCANDNCDAPISEFVTIKKYAFTDHNEKLKFDANQLGVSFKKPSNDNDYWFVQVGDRKGYIHKDYIRETKVLQKKTVKVEGDDPFTLKPTATGIKPSKPTVVDGTTIYDDELSGDDDTKHADPGQNIESTPPLNEDVKGTRNSTLQDNVDPSTLTETVFPSTVSSQDSEVVDSAESEKENISPPTVSTEGPVIKDSIAKSDGDVPSTLDQTPGVSSITPVDDYDDEISIENDEEEDIKEDVSTSHESITPDSKYGVNPGSTLEYGKPEVYPHFNPNSGSHQLPYGVLKASDSVNTEPIKKSEPALSNDNNVEKSETLPYQSVPEVTVKNIDIVNPNTSAYNEDQINNSLIENTDGVKPAISVNNRVDQSSSEDSSIHNISNISDGTVDNTNIENVPSVNKPESEGMTKPVLWSNSLGVPVAASQEQGSSSPLSAKTSVTHEYQPPPSFPEYSHEASVEQQQPGENVSNEAKVGNEQLVVSDGLSSPLHSNSYDNNQKSNDEVVTKEEEKISHDVDLSYPETYVTAENNLSAASSGPNSESADASTVSPDSAVNVEPTSATEPIVEHSPEIISPEPTDEAVEAEVSITPPPGNYNDDATTPSVEYDTPSSPMPEIQQPTDDDQISDTQDSSYENSGFYSSISSFLSSFQELFAKSQFESESPLSSSEPADQLPIAQEPTAAPGYCYDGESCGGLERPIGGEDQAQSYWRPSSSDLPSVWMPLSFNSLMYISITSVVVLIFSLGYYYIDKSQNLSSLVAKLNKLNQELFVTKKERDTLEEQLLKIKENCNIMDSSKMKQDSKLSHLQKSLQESQEAKLRLEETVSRLEKEVETLMEQGLEMHKLLSDTITDEERSQILLANVDELKESLSEKLDEIVSLTLQLDQSNQQIQLGQLDLRNANDRILELERKLETSKSESEQAFTSKLQDHQQRIIKLQKVLEEKGVNVAKLESELAKTKVERDSAEARASSAEAGLQAAHAVGADEAKQTWLDVTSIRAALVESNKANQTLKQSLEQVNSANTSLQERLKSLEEELSCLNSKYESVEKDKVNALTKLQVLSDYFKEKETKLQEELGMKESLWLQKESEDHSIYEQMKSLREEIASYKSQNDKLKSEILEQEASYKVQIANEGQKSYDNWVALRQAERKVKELQMESAHLRSRLTQIETCSSQQPLSEHSSVLEKSGLSAPSPPFMMLPPLPPDFFPLPPPPIHPSASRPPPLGRISSPQLSGEMIPPPPLVPFDMYPPPSSTPPPPLPLYKPQPRDRPPPPKDSPGSNYSPESTNDKAGRRRRR